GTQGRAVSSSWSSWRAGSFPRAVRVSSFLLELRPQPLESPVQPHFRCSLPDIQQFRDFGVTVSLDDLEDDDRAVLDREAIERVPQRLILRGITDPERFHVDRTGLPAAPCRAQSYQRDPY